MSEDILKISIYTENIINFWYALWERFFENCFMLTIFMGYSFSSAIKRWILLWQVWEQVKEKWDALHLNLLAQKSYQAWSRDHEIVSAWLTAKESLVGETYIGVTLPEVETQIKKLDDLKQSIKTQQTKIGRHTKYCSK